MKQLELREKLVILLDRLDGSSFPADRVPDFGLSKNHPLDVLTKMSSSEERGRNSWWFLIKQLFVIFFIYIGKLF